MDRRLIFGFLPTWHTDITSLPPGYTNDSYDEAMVAMMRRTDGGDNSHAQSCRISLNWDLIEPNAPVGGQHTYDWTTHEFDKQVDLLVAHGIEPLALVIGTPWWAKAIDRTGTATGGGTDYLDDSAGGFLTFNGDYDIQITSGAGQGQSRHVDAGRRTDTRMYVTEAWLTPPAAGSGYQIGGHAAFVMPQEAHRASFEAFCQAAASHYQGKIRYFEFWNEPDLGACTRFFNAATYTSWLHSAHGAIVGQNPDALVSIGGLLRADMGYLSGTGGIYPTIAASADTNPDHYFDALAYHPYPPGQPPFDPPIRYSSFEAYRNELVSHGDGEKSIWITEYGWALGSVITEAVQRDYLSESLQWLYAAERYYVTLATFHVFADHAGPSFGVCTSALQPRLAYTWFRDYAAPRTPTWEIKAPFVTLV